MGLLSAWEKGVLVLASQESGQYAAGAAVLGSYLLNPQSGHTLLCRGLSLYRLLLVAPTGAHCGRNLSLGTGTGMGAGPT